MTVETDTNKTDPIVMGASTYDFNFRVLLKNPTEEEAKKAIKATINDGENEIDLVYRSEPPDTENGEVAEDNEYWVELSEDGNGGRITVANPRTSSYKLVISREYDQKQLSDYNDFNSLPAETLEENFDKISMVLQQLQEQIGRAIKGEITSETDQQELVRKVNRIYESIQDIDNVSAHTAELEACEENMDAIIAAPAQAASAAQSAQSAEDNSALSRTWAIGDDEDIPEQGEHSSKGNANLAFAIANADEDVPIPEFETPAGVVIKGEKGDPAPDLEECLELINEEKRGAQEAIYTINTKTELVVNTAAQILAYKEQAEISATNAAQSEQLASNFANADEDVIITTE